MSQFIETDTLARIAESAEVNCHTGTSCWVTWERIAVLARLAESFQHTVSHLQGNRCNGAHCWALWSVFLLSCLLLIWGFSEVSQRTQMLNWVISKLIDVLLAPLAEPGEIELAYLARIARPCEIDLKFRHALVSLVRLKWSTGMPWWALWD